MQACSSDELQPTNSEISDGSTVSMVVPVGCRTIRIDYPTASGIKSLKASINPEVTEVEGRDLSPITTTSVNLFSAVNTYVNIYDEDGNKLVENYPVKAKVAVAPAGSISLPEDAVNEYVTSDGPFTFYHSSGVAMFDDTWPNYGDRDFNDVVLDYDIEVKTVDMAVAPKEAWRECVKVVMHLRAVGGGGAKNAGLALEGLDTRNIDSYTCKLTLGNYNEVLPKGHLFSPKVDLSGQYPIITFGNVNWMIWGASGSSATYVNSKTKATQKLNDVTSNNHYYNVWPGEVNVGGDLVTLTVTFKGKSRSSLSTAEGNAMIANFISAVMNTESQNFFITTGNGDEVHLKGYNPTPAYSGYGTAAATGVTMDNSTTYSSRDGYVWGCKVPVMTRHAWEKIAIYDAYPENRAWVTSKGATNADWYKRPVKSKVTCWW